MSEPNKIEIRNISKPGSVNEYKKKEDRKLQRDFDDLKAVLSTRNGRRFLWRTLSNCGVFELSYTGTSETYFREGQRNIGLKLMSEINDADKTAMSLMMRESMEDDNV